MIVSRTTRLILPSMLPCLLSIAPFSALATAARAAQPAAPPPPHPPLPPHHPPFPRPPPRRSRSRASRPTPAHARFHRPLRSHGELQARSLRASHQHAPRLPSLRLGRRQGNRLSDEIPDGPQ